MWQRNNGRAEEELQIKFTGYLIQAVRRTQRDYLKALYAYSNQETLTDTIFAVSQTLEQEVMERLPLWEKIESSALLYALKQLDERERYVFLARVLDKRPFDVIGVQLGLSYKGAHCASHVLYEDDYKWQLLQNLPFYHRSTLKKLPSRWLSFREKHLILS